MVVQHGPRTGNELLGVAGACQSVCTVPSETGRTPGSTDPRTAPAHVRWLPPVLGATQAAVSGHHEQGRFAGVDHSSKGQICISATGEHYGEPYPRSTLREPNAGLCSCTMSETKRVLLMLLGVVGIRVSEIVAGLFEDSLSCVEQSAFEEQLRQLTDGFRQRVLRLPLLLTGTSHEPTWCYTTDSTASRRHAQDLRSSTTGWAKSARPNPLYRSRLLRSHHLPMTMAAFGASRETAL
jgi:hypothetical protein